GGLRQARHACELTRSEFRRRRRETLQYVEAASERGDELPVGFSRRRLSFWPLRRGCSSLDHVNCCVAVYRVSGALMSRAGLAAQEVRGRRRTPGHRRIFALPDLGTLWVVVVPRPRLEVAERLVVHLIHFGEQFDDVVIRIAMIDKDIVTDAVPAGPPDERALVLRQHVASHPCPPQRMRIMQASRARRR